MVLWRHKFKYLHIQSGDIKQVQHQHNFKFLPSQSRIRHANPRDSFFHPASACSSSTIISKRLRWNQMWWHMLLHLPSIAYRRQLSWLLWPRARFELHLHLPSCRHISRDIRDFWSEGMRWYRGCQWCFWKRMERIWLLANCTSSRDRLDLLRFLSGN